MEQANGLVKRWLETSQKNDNGITLREARQDTGAVGLHVLASAAFGINYNFGRGAAPSEREHEMSFGMALKICMDNMAIGLVQVTFGLAKLGLPSWLLLHVMKNLRVAMYEMRDWIGKAIERERPERRQGGAAKDNFMSSLGRANEAEKDEHAKGRAKWTLNDIELQGNLFAISIAGHETTSGSLSNAIPCLAAHPEIQDWVRQEVDTVFRDGDVAYVDAMPRLVRIEALMYETLRFIPATPMQTKYVDNAPQVLNIDGREYNIPPLTFISINHNAVHFDPSTWGADVNDFRPSRFIKSPGESGNETFGIPEGTEFFWWDFGSRICPGTKFSQVEFVAVVARLLREFEFKPVRKAGESEEAAAKRLVETMTDVEHFFSGIPKRPDVARFVRVKRSQ